MNVKNNYIDIIIYAIVFFIIGFLTCGIFWQWDVVARTFWAVKITDVLQIVVTIVIGCIIAYQISVKSNKTIKRSDVFLEFFNKVQENVISIYNDSGCYMQKPDKNAAKTVIKDLRNLSIQISLLERLLGNNYKNVRHLVITIKNNYFELKATITGNHFNDTRAKYSEEEKRDLDKVYEKIMNNIYDAKISIYD